MSKDGKITDGTKKKRSKMILKIIIALFAVYVFLFTVRFIQLNFYGKQTWKADSLPGNIVKDVAHDFPEAYDDWENEDIPVQLVDLNGDFRIEFIMYTRSMIQVYTLSPQSRWKHTAIADLVEDFVYLPFTIYGYPTVMRMRKYTDQNGFFTKVESNDF